MKSPEFRRLRAHLHLAALPSRFAWQRIAAVGTCGVLILVVELLAFAAGSSFASATNGLMLARTLTWVGAVVTIGLLLAMVFLLPVKDSSHALSQPAIGSMDSGQKTPPMSGMEAAPSSRSDTLVADETAVSPPDTPCDEGASGPQWSEQVRRLRAGSVLGALLWAGAGATELAIRYVANPSARGAALDDAERLGTFALADPQGAAFFTHTVLAFAVAIASGRTRTNVSTVSCLVVAFLGVFALTVTGWAAEANLDTSLDAVAHRVAHLLATITWSAVVAGLVTLGWLFRGDVTSSEHPLGKAVLRLSDLALIVAVVTVISGGTLSVQAAQHADEDVVGFLWAAKVTGFLILLVFGYRHREHTIKEKLLQGEPLPFVRLAAIESAIMVLIITISVARDLTSLY